MSTSWSSFQGRRARRALPGPYQTKDPLFEQAYFLERAEPPLFFNGVRGLEVIGVLQCFKKKAA